MFLSPPEFKKKKKKNSLSAPSHSHTTPPHHLYCFSLLHGSSPALLSRTAPSGGRYGGFAVSLGLGEMVMMFSAAGGDVVCGGCGCVGAGGFVTICIRCGWVCVTVGLGLGEMVMMFAAGVGVGVLVLVVLLRSGSDLGGFVLPWVWVWAKW